MPNQPRADNRAHPVRVSDALWTQVLALASAQKTTASAVVRRAIETYVRTDRQESRT